jgi:hypothetical protein
LHVIGVGYGRSFVGLLRRFECFARKKGVILFFGLIILISPRAFDPKPSLDDSLRVSRRPSTLIAWGKNDFIFPLEGAASYKRRLAARCCGLAECAALGEHSGSATFDATCFPPIFQK